MSFKMKILNLLLINQPIMNLIINTILILPEKSIELILIELKILQKECIS